jgi:hypothetical protein
MNTLQPPPVSERGCGGRSPPRPPPPPGDVVSVAAHCRSSRCWASAATVWRWQRRDGNGGMYSVKRLVDRIVDRRVGLLALFVYSHLPGAHSTIRVAFDKSGKARFGWGQVPVNTPLSVNLRVERLVSGRFLAGNGPVSPLGMRRGGARAWWLRGKLLACHAERRANATDLTRAHQLRTVAAPEWKKSAHQEERKFARRALLSSNGHP